VEAGILASMAPHWIMESLARHGAVNVLDIMRGKLPGDTPAAFDPGQQFTINMATARAVGVYPSLTVLTMADLLHEERTDIERVVTLEGAVAEALEANLNLSALAKGVSAGSEAVKEARSRLLPQINLVSDAVVIDDDRAGAAGGTAPEKSWRGSINGSQVIWSEQVKSGYDVQRNLQMALEESFEALRLDVIRAAAVSYLNVLRAGTLEQILKDNLKLTRANLERARVRVSVGIAGPEEVYRWESQLADSRAQVLRAESQTLNAKAALNRLLNRPLEEEFLVREISLDDQVAAVMGSLYGTLIDSPKILKTFRRFLVAESMNFSPELRRFNAQIKAAERQVKASRRAFWLPDFSFRGDVTELLADGGEGQRGDSPLGIDDTEWSVGVFADLPLFNSGGKKATLARRREELSGLAIERAAEAERITTQVVTSVNLTRASYPAIRLSVAAAEAAGKNLGLVTDSYERGIKSIIDLLDAQNQALVSDQKAANAAHDFLVDLMSVERAVGRFFFLLAEQERRDWLVRFEEYAAAEGDRISLP
jgi:outer membrane protein TolC